jgi:NAD(P)H-nitrite reductase large subunit
VKREAFICRCEEVTREDVVRAVRAGARTVDAVKRATRAGLGLCQGSTCGRLVARIIAEETGRPLAKVRPATPRPPVRPIALGRLRGPSLRGRRAKRR